MALPGAPYTDEERAAAEALLGGQRMPEVAPDVLGLYGLGQAPVAPDVRLAQRNPYGLQFEPAAAPAVGLEDIARQQARERELQRLRSQGEMVADVPGFTGQESYARPEAERPAMPAAPLAAPTAGGLITRETARAAPVAAGGIPGPAPTDPFAGAVVQESLLRQFKGAPAAVQKIPEADILQGYTQGGAVPLTEEQRASLVSGFTAQQQANLAGIEAAKAADAQEALRHRAAADEATRANREFQQRQLDAQKAVEAQRQRIGNIMGAARDEKINPDRIWEGRTGARIVASIAMALGEYGRALTKSDRNLAAELVQKAVNDDIDAQRSAIESARASRMDLAHTQELLLGALQQHVADPVSAENLSRAYQLQAAQSELARQAASMKIPMEDQRVRELNAALEQQKAQLLGEVDAREAGQIQSTYRHQTAATRVVGGGGGEPAAWKWFHSRYPTASYNDFVAAWSKGQTPSGTTKDETPTEWRARQDAIQRQIRLPDGSIAYATQAKGAEETQKQINAVEQLRQNFSSLREIAGRAGKSLSATDRAAVRTIAQSNKLLMKEAEKLGAITQADQELVSPLAGEEIAAVTSFDAAQATAIEEAERHFTRRVDKSVENLYRDPAATEPVTRATGQQLGEQAPR